MNVRKLIEALVETAVMCAIIYGLMAIGWIARGLHYQQTGEAHANAARIRESHARATYFENLNAETRRREDARRPPSAQ